MAETYDAPLPWTGEIAAPLTLFRTAIRPDWIDDYGHVNVAHYVTICDHANWAFWNWINAPESEIEARGGQEYAIVEAHVCYLDELALGEEISVTTQLLGWDARRYVLFHEILKADGTLAATNEVKALAFDLNARRAGKWRESVAERLALIAEAHAALGPPERAGRAIALSGR